jgi:protein phosphatase
MDPGDIVHHFQTHFMPILRLTPEEVHWIGDRIPIPSFSLEQINGLLDATTTLLEGDKQALQDAPLPCWLVGDIHGNFHDLVRILVTVRDFSLERIVFLGDYVDRGSYSLDCLLLLFMLKCCHPHTIFLLRGNHEFACVNSEYGFKQEIEERFPDSGLFERCNSVFSLLPIGFQLGQAAICLHGGIGPTCKTVNTVRRLTLPIESYEQGDVVSEVVWSDPTHDTDEFITSARGCGVLFGRLAAHTFVKTANCGKIVRGHECVAGGFAVHGVIVTIFSSSNYCGKGNTAAFVHMDLEGQVTVKTLEPMSGLLERSNATYSEIRQVLARLPVLKTDSFARKIKVQPLLVRPTELKGQRRASLKGLVLTIPAAAHEHLPSISPVPLATTPEGEN